MVDERTRGAAFSGNVIAEIRRQGAAAAAAYREFGAFLQTSLASGLKVDRFALGTREYDWALANNLHVPATAAELFESSWSIVERTREALIATARTVAESSKRALAWDVSSREASTRAVMDDLAKDAPRDDVEMVRWYSETCLKLVEFARKNDMFDIPREYRLEVVVTPPTLESAIDGAAYYPAPPFRASGIGRFYVSPTKGDPEQLKQNDRASIADLSAHEGFPGHDWNYKVMTQYRDAITPVRWLTPGEVEGSASMWEDSMAGEGWGLYAEHLMGEPQPNAPSGYYSPEERIYALQGELYRDLRVRIDTGLHTGRLGYNEAVDLFSQVVDFLPGSCRGTSLAPQKKASCESAERAIYRYSKWPTQAITYRLGKDRILALRAQADQIAPGPAGRKRFHVLFMRQGSIPPDYFGDEVLAELKAGR
jgi:uncharacterized protein (DUF885 family)